MGHTFSNNLYHIIFSTKDRCQILPDRDREQIHCYIGGILRNLDCKLMKINSVSDHAHLLCNIRPSVAVSDIVRKIKSNSSRRIKENVDLPCGFQWQSGFSCFSVSESSVNSVVRYIDAQQEHHQTVTYEDELKVFLEKHGVDYDPRHYLD